MYMTFGSPGPQVSKHTQSYSPMVSGGGQYRTTVVCLKDPDRRLQLHKALAR